MGRKRKNWAGTRKHKKSKKSKWGVNPAANVTPGGPMILVTCEDTKEKRAAEEVINWLSSKADEYYPKEPDQETKSEANEEENPSSSANVADELEAELNALRAEKKESEQGDSKGRRFVLDKMDGKAMVIVRVRDEALPLSELVTRVMRETQKNGASETRFTHRILPMTHTCFSKFDKFKLIAEKAVKGFFENNIGATGADDSAETPFAGKTFAVFYKSRGTKNKQMEKMDLINHVVGLMPKGMKVSLDDPDFTVFVQIIGRLTGVGVVRDFKRLAEFNVRALVEKANSKVR